MWRCMADRSLPSLLGLVGVMRVVALGLTLGAPDLPWLGLQGACQSTGWTAAAAAASSAPRCIELSVLCAEAMQVGSLSCSGVQTMRPGQGRIRVD